MGRLVLVVGGAKSGKSRTAQRLATASGASVVVVTPADARDPELAQRIARHRADRPAGWRTLETYDVTAALNDVGDGVCVVVDALDTWLLHTVETRGLWTDAATGPLDEVEQGAWDQILGEIDACAAAARRRSGTTIVIAGLVSAGIHPLGAGTRRYVDLHGLACQRLGDSADEVLLVVAGRTFRPQPWAGPP